MLEENWYWVSEDRSLSKGVEAFLFFALRASHFFCPLFVSLLGLYGVAMSFLGSGGHCQFGTLVEDILW